MNPEPSLAVALLALVISVLVWGAAGRALWWQVEDTRPVWPVCVVAGMALWCLVWVAMVPLGGGHTLVAAGVFGVLMLAMQVPALRDWARNKTADTHWMTLAVLVGLLLAPLWVLLPNITPTLSSEFGFLRAMQYVQGLGRWPLAGGAELGLPQPLLQAPALWVPLLMPWVVGVAASSMAAWNMLGVLLVAVWVAEVGVRGGAAQVRWSNALWLAALGLVGAVGVWWAWKPQSWPEPSLWLPVLAVGCAVFPLGRGGKPPVGYAALPYALPLMLVVWASPWGFVAAGLVALAWTLVAFAWLQRGANPTHVVLALSWVACVPLLAAMVGSHAGLGPWAGVCGQGWGLACMAQGLEGAQGGMVQLLPMAGLVGVWAVLPWLQRVYTGSPVVGWVYKAPWVWGLVVALPTMGVVGWLGQGMVMPASPTVAHVAVVAPRLVAQGLWQPPQPVAVQGVDEPTRMALGYALRLPLSQPYVVPNNLSMAELHGTLLVHNVAWLWQGPQAAQAMAGGEGLAPATLWHQVLPDALVVRGLYPLLASE